MVGRPLAADLDQPQVRNRLPDRRDHVEQHVDPLPLVAGANVEHPGSSVKFGEPRQLYRGLGRAGGELGRHSIGSEDQPVGVDQARPPDLFSNGDGTMEHDRRLPQPGQDTAGTWRRNHRGLGLATVSNRQRKASTSWQYTPVRAAGRA